MSKFPELSNEEIFDILLCGGNQEEDILYRTM